MRPTWSWPTRRTMVVLGALILLLGTMSSASAAKPSEAEVTVDITAATCDGPNEVSVTAVATTNVDLNSFDVSVARWETVTSASPNDFNGLGQVEHWSANFYRSGKASSIPTSHTLTTHNSGTWHGSSLRLGGFEESHDLFVISAGAVGAGKGNAGRSGEWVEWVLDCSTGAADLVPYISMWEGAWEETPGDL